VGLAAGCASLGGLTGGEGDASVDDGSIPRDGAPRDATHERVFDSATASTDARPRDAAHDGDASPGTPFIKDTFARTVTNGLGTADIGGAWTLSGLPSDFSVVPGAGRITMSAAADGPAAELDATSVASADVTTTFSLNKVGNQTGTYIRIIGRRVSATEQYQGLVHVLSTGEVDLSLEKLDGSTTAAVLEEDLSTGLIYTAGAALNARLQVTGTNPTKLAFRAWAATSPEPTTWAASVSDSSAALQSPGSVGLSAYLGGSSTSAPVVASFSSLVGVPVAL
jgi:hypothetical protein